MHYNENLKNDLTIYFRIKKKKAYCTLFNQPFTLNQGMFNYFIRIGLLFDMLDKPLMETLILRNSINEKCISKMYHGEELYFNKGFKVSDFFTMIENNSVLSKKISKLSECYDTFKSVDNVYRVSGHDQVVVKTNPRYTHSLRRVFNRFGANIHCVESCDTVSKFEIIFEVKANDSNSGSNK